MNGLELPDPGEPHFCARCASPLEMRHDGGRPRPRCLRCGWTYYAKPALGAAVLIEEDGRILLVRRAHEPVLGWWTLPAGYVEYGEDAAQTAAREALEETGLVVSIDGFHGIFAGFGDPRGAGNLAVFHATRVVGEPIAGDDAAEVRWFGADEIPTEIAFEGSRKAISAWLTRRANGLLEPILMSYADAGPAPPILVYVVVENPRGSTDRVAYDEQSHEFKATGETFRAPLPAHYGWIPRTFTAADGEEIDAIVIGEGVAAVGSVIVARTIGALRADDDHKIIAVRADLPTASATVVDLEQSSDLRDQIEHVFAGRSSITGWASAAEARGMVLAAQRDRLERENEARAEHATPALPAGTAG
jgi:8-oxo-dGTP diphosphatase